MTKKEQIIKLRERIARCPECTSNSGKGMLNVIAKNHSFAPRTIGYWNDVFQNYDAKLMIVGQDWGNKKYLQTFLSQHNGHLPEPANYWEKGNPTWKNLMFFLHGAGFKAVDGAYRFSDIYLTNALLCIRKGPMSGNKGLDNNWFHKCFEFLKEQIKIIKPKIIATLGKNVFHVFEKEYALSPSTIPKSFRDVVAKRYKTPDGIVIFPLYHTGSYGVLNRGERNVERGRQGMLADFKALKMLYDEQNIR